MNPAVQLKLSVAAAKNSEALIQALNLYYREAGSISQGLIDEAPKPLACRSGCSFCCYIPVAAQAQEIFLLASFIKQRFSDAEQNDIIDRLRRHTAIVIQLTGTQQHTTNIPCPLLKDSCCSVYSARPLACRFYHSLDVSVCEAMHIDPDDLVRAAPSDRTLASAWQNMTMYSNGSFAHSGYDQTGYELGSALLEALTKSATWRRFRQGKKAFPEAKSF